MVELSVALSVIQKRNRVLCHLTEAGRFVAHLLPYKDAIELAIELGDGCNARPLPDLLALQTKDWFDYGIDEVSPFEPNEFWLVPNRHPACQSVNDLLHKLHGQVFEWQQIQSILCDLENPLSQSLTEEMGEDVMLDLDCMVSELEHFLDYNIVEI